MALSSDVVDAARRHLRRRDPVMRRLVDSVGPCTLKVRRDKFRMLVGSIISQQISWKAAKKIRERLELLVAPAGVTPHTLAALTLVELRAAGISPQKAGYLHDLAAKVDAGAVRLGRVGRMADEAVIAELVQVK
ncbi:MAG TPA: DNA-3-methyladenine glycosylase 2 family protein, partial [Planctomycetaceae bacterium]|nr:DNA-3-methyladenine glycosylase 2 family protein [Planctomycetaceae bacterium]